MSELLEYYTPGNPSHEFSQTNGVITPFFNQDLICEETRTEYIEFRFLSFLVRQSFIKHRVLFGVLINILVFYRSRVVPF